MTTLAEPRLPPSTDFGNAKPSRWGSPCTQAQAGDIGAPAVFQDLAATPGVEIQLKRLGAPLIHLESYQIDGRRLRTGAANFSASGEKQIMI